MTEVPFIYIVAYAFKLLLTYDDKRKIKIKNLILFHKLVLERLIDEYEEEYNEDMQDEVFLDEDIDYEEELVNIIKNYSNVFSLVNDTLTVKESIDLTHIEAILTQYPQNCKLGMATHTRDIYETLGIKNIFKIKDKVEKIGVNLEKEIEEEYLNNPKSLKIKQLLLKRAFFLTAIYANYYDLVKYYFALPENEEEEEMNYITEDDDDFDNFEESRYNINDEEYPIDRNLYENSDYYEDETETINTLLDNLEDSTQYAIFGNEPLYIDKYTDNLTELSFNTIVTANPNNIALNFDTDFVFNIIYIKKLNGLINEGLIELSKIRNRLLYLLDNNQYCLYDIKNFDIIYQNACQFKNNKQAFQFLSNQARYFIVEIFEGQNHKKLEKLVFVAAYYELTNDNKIIDILKQYNHYPNYEQYFKIIVEQTKEKTKKMNYKYEKGESSK